MPVFTHTRWWGESMWRPIRVCAPLMTDCFSWSQANKLLAFSTLPFVCAFGESVVAVNQTSGTWRRHSKSAILAKLVEASQIDGLENVEPGLIYVFPKTFCLVIYLFFCCCCFCILFFCFSQKMSEATGFRSAKSASAWIFFQKCCLCGV